VAITGVGPDLLIRGGTVVTAGGSSRADVAVRGGSIEAIDADLSGQAATAGEVVDATGQLVLPGCVDVHTHTRVASDEEPDRFYVPAYVGHRGWLGVRLDRSPDWTEVAEIIEDAYRAVAGPRHLKLLDQ